jgi:hypothetical protein
MNEVATTNEGDIVMSTLPSHDATWSTSATASEAGAIADPRLIVRAGLLGGLVGGVIIWIYEAIVWVGVQHLMPLAGIPRNATGLVFGKEVQDQLGTLAYVVGTAIHFFFVLAGACCSPSRGRTSAVADMKQRSWHCSLPSSFGS